MVAIMTSECGKAGSVRPVGDVPAGWLSIRQAAAYAQVSQKMIRRAIHARGRERLTAYNVGSLRRATWRMKSSDLESWLQRNAGGDPFPTPPTYRASRRSRYFPSF